MWRRYWTWIFSILIHLMLLAMLWVKWPTSSIFLAGKKSAPHIVMAEAVMKLPKKPTPRMRHQLHVTKPVRRSRRRTKHSSPRHHAKQPKRHPLRRRAHLKKKAKLTPVLDKKKLQKEAQQLAEQRLKEQLLQEGKLLQQARSRRVQGVVDEYKAQILRAIASQWRIPDEVDPTLSTELLLRLAPGGVVISVDIKKSSGDSVLDRSAVTAVWRAAPLPVPRSAEIFERFRSIRLTVRPEMVQVVSY